jgi:hypothetical protein
MRDKLWFYGAYNQFHIDKQVSGVAQDVATDLGKFNNYTGKGTYKASQNNTIIGYVQMGRKQKPYRNLSTLVPPESILAQNSWSKMYKGEWQSVLSDRAFLNVTVGRFTLDWPMVPAVDPRAGSANIPNIYRGDNSQTGSGWNAFSTFRSKPQVKAQATYYVPSKAGSHDFKFGFEDIYDSYHFGINGQSGPYRISHQAKGLQPDRIRFIDTGLPGDYNNTWTAGATTDQHYAVYVQDRWAFNNRVSLTAGFRWDYQDIGYKDGTRKPEICDATTALQDGDGGQIFPCESSVPGASFFSNNDIAARVGVSFSLTGDGRSVLKAFYGRYYNNLADGFSAANPAGQRYAEYNFTDLDGNGAYSGVQELGTFRTRLGGADAPVSPNTKTPYTDEYSVTMERQFWGESSVRGTYVRKMQKDFVPFYGTPLVSAWIGQVNVPLTGTFLGTTYNLLDVPNSLQGETGTEYTNYPDSDFTYDTIEVAFTKRVGHAFFQASGDYQWRDELRTADMTSPASTTSPLGTDPIGVFPQISVNPNAGNRQKTTMYHAQMAGHYTFAHDFGLGVNYRFQSGFPYAGIVPDGAVVTTAQTATTNSDGAFIPNVCNFNCSFFSQNLDQNRSESVNLMNFRIDKAFQLGGTKKATLMLDIYNILNADPVTNFNQILGASYKTVIAVLDPRVFQMGFRFEF